MRCADGAGITPDQYNSSLTIYYAIYGLANLPANLLLKWTVKRSNGSHWLLPFMTFAFGVITMCHAWMTKSVLRSFAAAADPAATPSSASSARSSVSSRASPCPASPTSSPATVRSCCCGLADMVRHPPRAHLPHFALPRRQRRARWRLRRSASLAWAILTWAAPRLGLPRLGIVRPGHGAIDSLELH